MTYTRYIPDNEERHVETKLVYSGNVNLHVCRTRKSNVESTCKNTEKSIQNYVKKRERDFNASEKKIQTTIEIICENGEQNTKKETNKTKKNGEQLTQTITQNGIKTTTTNIQRESKQGIEPEKSLWMQNAVNVAQPRIWSIII